MTDSYQVSVEILKGKIKLSSRRDTIANNVKATLKITFFTLKAIIVIRGGERGDSPIIDLVSEVKKQRQGISDGRTNCAQSH